MARRHDPHRALVRAIYAATAGTFAATVAWSKGIPFGLLYGWNAGGLVLLALSWLVVVKATPESTQRRAAAEDPGRTFVYGFVLVASTVSLVAAVVLSRTAKGLPADQAHELSILCLASVAISWALLHTAFTLRYARLYYREDKEGVGGVDFPGKGKPSYFDFAYFAFTIGMCFQTSDVCVSSPQIRKAVLLQAVIAFSYNTAILAFVLNLVFGQV